MIERLTTFKVGGVLFGVDVMKVQEVAMAQTVFAVPQAPVFVKGLVNLRGQILTAIGMREVFSSDNLRDQKDARMSIVCDVTGGLVSLMVDSVGDVVQVDAESFESLPDSVTGEFRRYIKGVYKMNQGLLSVLDLDVLAAELD